MKRISIALLALLTGCATTLDPNFALQLDAYRMAITSQQTIELAKARAEEARYNALAQIADRADAQSKQMAILALALGRGSGEVARPIPVVLPNIPESQEDRALKWAAIFAGPVTSVATGYFGYKLGVQQSNNQANTTIASYNAFSATAVAGLNTSRDIANSGINGIGTIATTAFTTLPMLKPTTPNVTIGGNGVIGNGRYVGDNSGENSGNQGIIRQHSPDTTQRNCNGGTTDAGGNSGATC